MKYISLGSECSAAAALKNLGLRDASYPFDWLDANKGDMSKCLIEKFDHFMRDPVLSSTRIIANYDFEFPHDFPKTDVKQGEEFLIVDNWKDYLEEVRKKYQRRINRFLAILMGNEPIIFLRRDSPSDRVVNLMSSISQINPFLKFGVAIASKHKYELPMTATCDPEKNGVWNDAEIWAEGIDRVKSLF